MRPMAKECDISIARIALAWLSSRPQIFSVIIGARIMELLKENLVAPDVSPAKMEPWTRSIACPRNIGAGCWIGRPSTEPNHRNENHNTSSNRFFDPA